MSVADITLLYDYSYWANRKLFAVMAELSPQDFTKSVAGSYESLRNTMVHVLSAEAGWLERCGGPPRGPKLDPDNYPTLESVTNAWARVETEMRAFLAGLSDEDLARAAEFEFPPGTRRSFPVGELLHHGANHAVHHRGQVALLLRLLGKAPGNVDLIIYFAEKQGTGGW